MLKPITSAIIIINIIIQESAVGPDSYKAQQYLKALTPGGNQLFKFADDI